MDDLESILAKERNLQRELNSNLKIIFISKVSFAVMAYKSLDYLLDGRYTQSALMLIPALIIGSVIVAGNKMVKRHASGDYIPMPSITIPAGIVLCAYGLNELYHSLLNGPLLNP